MRRLKSIVGTALCFIVPTGALAHTGAGPADVFAHGFFHPLSGVDHILAMIAVGLVAAQIGGRALISLPLIFLSAMALGGFMGATAIPMPFVEPGLAASVAVLGAMLAVGRYGPAPLLMAIVAAFAMAHGYAHGTEMTGGSLVGYGAGFLTTTALLHGVGIALGLLAGRTPSAMALRLPQASGVAIAATGLVLLAGSM